MTTFILDSSVILAVVKSERGGESVAAFAVGALISSVSIAELVTKCVELNLPPESALAFVYGQNIRIVDFDYELAVLAGTLARKARKGVLSLGDRACIATAIRHNGTAVTADRVWATLDLGCPVELIR